MNPRDAERFRQAREIFDLAVELRGAERTALLEELCRGDEELRRDVEDLLTLDSPTAKEVRGVVEAAARDVLRETSGRSAGGPGRLAPGERVAHYFVESALGRGGMGEVYLARDVRLGRRVALKVLPSHLSEDTERGARFRREARSLAALNHPGIVTLHSVEDHDGSPVLTMEWVNGRRLHDEIPPVGMDLGRFERLALQLTDALGAAHQQGVVHRDLKPDNVMVTADDRVKVMDFGLAKWVGDRGGADGEPGGLGSTVEPTAVGVLMGTAPYMSPEQVESRSVDPRSDVFSLGCVLYEMLAGRKAFRGDSTPSVMAAVLRDSPEPLGTARPGLPQRLVALVDRCLEKSPDERWSDGSAVHSALTECLVAGDGGFDDRDAPLSAAGPSRHRGRPLPANSSRVGVTVALAVALVVVVGGWLVWRLLSGGAPSGGGPDASASIESLAVLPLQDFSVEREEYLTDGITAALITELSKIESLRVISLTSVMPFKERTETLPVVAERLGVEAVLDGSIVRDGDRLALTASLVRARNERTLWSATYERELKDVLALQRTVASAVAEEVVAVVSPADRARLRRQSAIDPRAYEAMIRGNYLWDRLDREHGLALLREAVEIDPSFALGWATLSDAYLQMANDDPRVVASARAAAQRAKELDPELAEAWTALGAIASYFDWSWADAEQELRNALRLNPGYDQAHQVYGDYLEFLGHWDEAIAEGIRSTEVSPTSAAMHMNLGITYIFARRYAEAERACEVARELEPQYFMAHRCLAESLAGQGKTEDALASLERAVALAPDDQPLMAQQAILYQAAGQGGRAREVARRLEEIRADGDYVSPLIEGMVHMALGETETALDWIGLAVEEKAPWTPGIHAWPYFDPLRGRPRFEELVRRVGLDD